MKKNYLILLVLIMFSARVNAQSFSVANADNYIQGAAGFAVLEGSADIVNNSSTSKDVVMFRSINNIAPGHSSYFCWGINCYGPMTDTATYLETIAPGASSLARADLNPMGFAGYSEVTYCWYDVNNPTDRVTLMFTYDITTGINQITASDGDFVSLPFPNPSDGSTVISYNLKNQNADSKIVFYNVIGSKVMEIKVDNSKHDIQINTSALQAGVYYYSFISGNKAISTNKLVVSHKN